MAVYVDSLFATKPSRRWPYRQACHLTCGGEIEELHVFARRLGLKRSYFQGHHANPALWHYDLTANKRVQAVRLGAIEITPQLVAERIGLSKKFHDRGLTSPLWVDDGGQPAQNTPDSQGNGHRPSL